MNGLLPFLGFTVVFAMFGRRLSFTFLTAPMVFLAFGFSLSGLDLLPAETLEEVLKLVAEVALILLLFLDAAKINLGVLRKNHLWSQRMLLLGLPLSIFIGGVSAWYFLPGWPIVAVLLVAALLAPTDAALGQAVVTNTQIPERPRRALTMESGLNDGLALPVILLLASLTANTEASTDTNWLLFGFLQLVLGPLAGIAIGGIGGCFLIWAKKHEFTSTTFEGVATISLAGFAYLGATVIGGNGFIAAFVAGLVFGNLLKGRCKFVFEFAESDGQLLTWAAFFLLGLVLLPEAIAHLTWQTLAIILISLFIVRPLAIFLSLMGTDASVTTRLFFGWFGPRGLATALFALLVVHEIDRDFAEPILSLAINAVWISALLHGLSALPGANWYAKRIKAKGDCPETKPVPPVNPLNTEGS